MARDIASALGAKSRGDGCLYNAEYVVTYAYGHLIELAEPADYNAEWKSWDLAHLPMFPAEFKYRVNSSGENQFNIIRKLLLDSDISLVINACDAGREGELIFALIYDQSGCRLPVKRLWIKSLTEQAILRAFDNLKPSAEYAGMLDAARLRQQADWLVGINATRAQTLVARESGGEGVYSIGRVQTPTLAIVVNRDLEIENFVPQKYYEISAQFGVLNSTEHFTARLVEDQSRQLRKFFDQNDLAAFFKQLKTTAASTCSVIDLLEKKDSQTPPPLLFDLTTLQRTANVGFGFSASETLEIMQSLYEKKLLSYPRTSSRYLSSDVAAEVYDYLDNLPNDYQHFVSEIQAKEYRIGEKYVDDSKVTDHHAIVPTGESKGFDSLSENELKIYDLVVRRFFAVFYPAARDERVTVIIKIGMYPFLARGATEISSGWRIVEKQTELEDDNKTSDDNDSEVLPPLERDTVLQLAALSELEKQTRQPNRITENTLLQAMESAGKFIADDSLRESMKSLGLGTQATRHSIIETLVKRGYLVKDKRFIRATPTGREIIRRLVESMSLLASPSLTGQWENALQNVEDGNLSVAAFSLNIKELVKTVVSQILSQKRIAAANGATTDFGAIEGKMICPKCRAADRTGFLRNFNYQGIVLSACTLSRDVCGYVTVKPTTESFAEQLLSQECPLCAAKVLRFALTKAKKTPYLKCVADDSCEGIIWLSPRKQKRRKKNYG